MSGLIDPRKMIMWAALGALAPLLADASQPTEIFVTDDPPLADYENATVPMADGITAAEHFGDAPSGTMGPGFVSTPHGAPVSPGVVNRILRPADHRVSGQIDALFLWQGNIPSRPLFAANGTQETALDANDLLPEMAAGARYGLFLHLDNCYAIEGNYLNVRPFEAERTLPTSATGYEELNLAGLTFDDITNSTVMSSSKIQSAEFNWRRRNGPLTWLAGFRWVEWNESLSFDNQSPFGTEMIDVDVGNNLYGGQLGYDFMLWNAKKRVRVSTLGKAGVFYNQAIQRTNVVSPGSPPLAVGVTSEAEQTSFFGEIGGTMSVRLTKWLDWRLGYSLFWLSGVATPAQQLSLVNVETNPPTTDLDTGGSVLLHGATTGLEARW